MTTTTKVRYPLAGATNRKVGAKLTDQVSVFDFMTEAQIADVQAQTLLIDCSAAIQQAYFTGKTVFFPMGWYRCNSTINAQFATHSVGEASYYTRIIKFGGGALFTFVVSTAQYVFENLRFGGTGATGFTGNGGGYTNYVSCLTLKNCDFDKDLAFGINASLIYFRAENVTFGCYGDTSYPGGQHIVSSFAGANNTNVGEVVGCRFFAALGTSVQLTGGFQWTFRQCDWTNNAGRLVVTNDIGVLAFEKCYAEINTHPTSLILCSATGNQALVRHVDWVITNNTCPHIFSYGGTQKMLLDGNTIALAASATVLYNNGTTSVALPNDGTITIRNHSVTGNAADATVKYNGIIDGAVTAWTPTQTNLTVVPGSGAQTLTGFYSVTNGVCNFAIKVGQTGTCTTANSTGGNAWFTLPLGLFPTVMNGACSMVTDSSVSLGNPLVYVNGRVYPPNFTATGGQIHISGWFFI